MYYFSGLVHMTFPINFYIYLFQHLSHDSTEGSTSSSVCGSSPAPSPAATSNHSNDHGANDLSQLTAVNSSSSHHDRKRPIKSEDSSKSVSCHFFFYKNPMSFVSGLGFHFLLLVAYDPVLLPASSLSCRRLN